MEEGGRSVILVPCHYSHFSSAHSPVFNNAMQILSYSTKISTNVLSQYTNIRWRSQTEGWCWTFATAWEGTKCFISRKCVTADTLTCWFVKHLTTCPPDYPTACNRVTKCESELLCFNVNLLAFLFCFVLFFFILQFYYITSFHVFIHYISSWVFIFTYCLETPQFIFIHVWINCHLILEMQL